MLNKKINYKFLQIQDYADTLFAMQKFTITRQRDTMDEIWFLEHPKVFTLGKSCSMEHVLYPEEVAIIKSDRGGQVTYHGPGQLIVYFLIDLVRRSLTVKSLIYLLQQSVIDLLWCYFNIYAEANSDAPGVYVAGKKICSIGLKVTRGCSYHGISFNVNMDLSPFKQINPCGYVGLEMTQLKDLVPNTNFNVNHIAKLFQGVLSFKF